MGSLTRCQPRLGTYVEVSVSGDVCESELINASNSAFLEISRIHDLMSFHEQTSELTRVNKHAAVAPVEVSRATKFVIEQALIISDKTEGVFDISIAPELIAKKALPNHNFGALATGDWRDIEIIGNKVRFKKPLLIDLGGIAKGYAVDKAVNAVDESIDIIVNAGGDLRMRPWTGNQVEVRRPEAPNSKVTRVPMKNCALATSASYYSEFGTTIVSKHCSELVTNEGESHNSVSVFASNCLIADALTKVAYLKPDMIKKSIFPNVHFMTLNSNNEIDWY
jgi:FAD:protein FMN transferase